MNRLLVFFLIGFSLQGTAQTLTVDAVSMTITDGTTVFVDTDVINKGNLTNNGELFVSGSWMNVGNYFPESGELILNSSSKQVINHNAQTFQRLTIRGGGQKVIMDDLKIAESLVFEQGRLLIEPGAEMTIEDGATVAGADEESYVVGALYREGTGTLDFPIGSDDEYLPVILEQVTQNDSKIGMVAYSIAPPQGRDRELRVVSNERFWQLIPSINFSGALITIPVSNEPFLRNEEDAKLAVAASKNDAFTSLDGTYANGAITSSVPVFGGYYAIGTENRAAPPIRVLNAVTPNGSPGINDYLQIDNITYYEDNRVDIFDRTGRLVYSQENYDNRRRVFRGFSNQANSNQLLNSGTYYYSILLGGGEVESGFLYLKY